MCVNPKKGLHFIDSRLRESKKQNSIVSARAQKGCFSFPRSLEFASESGRQTRYRVPGAAFLAALAGGAVKAPADETQSVSCALFRAAPPSSARAWTTARLSCRAGRTRVRRAADHRRRRVGRVASGRRYQFSADARRDRVSRAADSVTHTDSDPDARSHTHSRAAS